MSILAACASQLSLLPALEPMAGAALAVNLAYLNLDRFRYRRQIAEHATKELDRLQIDGRPAPPPDSDLYQTVQRLAALPNYDGDGDIEETEGSPKKTRKRKTKPSMPDGRWWVVYKYIFERHVDRYVCFTLTGIALITFFVGTAHSIGHLTSIHCLFSEDLGVFSLYLLFAALVIPIVFVFLGGRLVRWAQGHSTWCIKEIEHVMARNVDRAQLKEPIHE